MARVSRSVLFGLLFNLLHIFWFGLTAFVGVGDGQAGRLGFGVK